MLRTVRQEKIEGNVLERLRRLELFVDSLQRKDVTSDQLLDFADEIGERYDSMGYVLSKQLNLHNYEAATVELEPAIIPLDTWVPGNILHVTVRGRMYNNSGGSETLTPEIWLGVLDSEAQIDDGSNHTISTSNYVRGFTYTLELSRSPSGGDDYVLVHSKMRWDYATDNNPIGTNTRYISYQNAVIDSNSLILKFASSNLNDLKIWLDTYRIELIDNVPDDIKVFTSRALADTYINSAGTSTNYDTLGQISIGENISAPAVWRGLVAFDHDGIRNIPDNAELISAKIFMVHYENKAANNRTMNVHRVLLPYTYDLVSWSHRKYATVPWTSPGLGSGTDYDATVFGSGDTTTADAVGQPLVIDCDLTEVQKIIDGTYTDIGQFVFIMETENNDGHRYDALNLTLHGDTAPFMEIMYRVPGDA